MIWMSLLIGILLAIVIYLTFIWYLSVKPELPWFMVLFMIIFQLVTLPLNPPP